MTCSNAYATHTDAWLIDIDGNGNLLWEKSIGGSGADRREALVELLEQKAPVQPQHGRAEDRDGEHEQHRVPGGQAGAEGKRHVACVT